ncbi:glycoside hydrolase family 130 protein [Pedobacter gandavensis]|uniref:Pesticidal protein Cry7Aa n=1 Tax=Pedobacter gandavensis TaxID=2679963 RepID=A0ABR6EQD8_9SPHI|nr:pesticidal protein Cry7Aa [Pedobacter gandavensis]MBB2147456.1 pesticidal protein Cry7Aa [Pedobacter gandavensis]
MIRVTKEGVILRKTDLDFENEAVLNPAIIREGDSVYLFYRAVRKGNYSSIGFCKLDGPLMVKERLHVPLLVPEFEYESHGMEDPRIVKIDDLYYLTYVAYNGMDAFGALATSKDLKHFDKQGLIVPAIKINEFRDIVLPLDKVTNKYFTMNTGNGFLMNKDVVFFPRRINNKLYFIHRIKPEIQLVAINSLQELTKEFWQNYFRHFEENIMLTPRYSQELSYIGAGCPPIETKEGWLLIYHGVQEVAKKYTYSVRVALLDLDDPRKEIAQLPYQLFKPMNDYELSGVVNKVCFPTGTALFGDTLYIYYGAADEQIACASLSLSSLLDELLVIKI